MNTAHSELVRGGAATAAVVLAVLSLGDALVLAAVLVIVAWRLPALIVVPALLASSWRWGSTSLDALAGAQAVLGPAGLVGPGRAAAASWLVAAALVLSSPAGRRRVAGTLNAAGSPGIAVARFPLDIVTGLAAVAIGATAADVVAGPSLGGDWWVRVVATVVATGLALVVSKVRHTHERAIDALAIAGGLAALVLVAADAPSWSGTIDGPGVRDGVLLAVAAAAATTVGARAMTAMRDHRA